MSETYYKEAQKLAQREYRSCLMKGAYPYLPVLNDMLPPEKTSMGIDLGLMTIPTENIVGTLSAGRTTAFARNFMPLLDGKTEFAVKWERLCAAHLKEGIRDPIKVYEYMNRYYVQEGNKRVSVLKFFDAVSIHANVTRIMPERNGSKEVEIYYEFVDFYKYSNINCIEFSKLGSYTALQRLIGKAPAEKWSDEDQTQFRTIFHYFRQAYEANGGKHLRSTVGDALLAYIKIYGYSSMSNLNTSEMKKSVAKAWDEITLQQEEEPIDLKLEPVNNSDSNKKALFKPIAKMLKVAFIHDKSPEESGWTYAHELGVKHIQQVLKDSVTTVSYNNALAVDPLDVIQQAIDDGASVIFTTSPRLLPASLKAAVEYKNIIFLNCSLNTPHKYLRTYYARMYEAKFITGAIAGALSQSNRIGYICDYPIYGMTAGINAFALGAKMINPYVKVYLEWSSLEGGVDAATKRLNDKGIDLISSQDMARLEHGGRSNFGLEQINSDANNNIAMPIWHWGIYYEKIIRSILNKTFKDENNNKSLNYYWGLSAGVVELVYSKRLPDETKRLIELLRQAISNGICKPFQAPITTQDGYKIDADLSLPQIINMDWLADNIIGSIPKYSDMSYEAQEIVKMMGIDKIKQENKL